MTPERWRQVEELFHSALEREPGRRAAFLHEACRGDAELRREVESLLAQDGGSQVLGQGGAERLFESDSPSRLAAGSQLGPYRIEALLGAGGMGEVYRARDTRLRRTVAVKVLPRDGEAAYAERKRRFLQEARAASALNHPNIVLLHDIASDQGLDFLVLEYVNGKTLKELLAGGALTLDEIARYGAQAASALATAHAAGIVHRDIKPANIMIAGGSQVKVLDFGVAKLTEQVGTESATRMAGETAHTTPGMVVGTVSYMSPEQTRGEPLDGRSDVFSLGCVLYEAATGRLPFRGPSTLAVMHEIATATPPAPSSIRPDVPVEFDVVVERALAKDKERRYATALDLAAALESLQTRAPAVLRHQAERRPAAFVGREPELRKLGDLLKNAVGGAGKIVFLSGEPGIGKSALAEAFLFEAGRGAADLLVGRGTCVEQFGAGEAYLPFLDALSGLLNGVSRDRVLAVLRRHAPTWCLQFPGAFASSGTFEQLQKETIGATKERMLREFGDALGALAAAGPVALLLEDLHWSDPASIDLLRHLAPRAGTQRLLLIGTLRPEDVERSNHPLKNCKREIEAHNWSDEIALRPLLSEHVAGYLDARFQPNDFPPELFRWIYRKTEGHPLFSAALIQLLAERGDIARTNAHWTLTRPVGDLGLEVPESVRGMIRRKLEALDVDDRRALQYASIEGEEFTSTIVAGMLGADELALEQRLDRLDRVHRLIDTRAEEELPDGALATKYRFAHALYQNILYEDLVSKQRLLLHRRAGEQLERRYGDETARVAVALAAHFERGREYRKAIQYLMQAAEVATERCAGSAAEEDISRALRLVEKLPRAEQPATEIQLLQERGSVRLALGRMAEAESDFNAMLERARASHEPVHECTALNALANPFFTTTAQPRLDQMRRAEEALQAAERAGDPALRAEAMVNLALRHSVVGEPLVAKDLFEAAIPLARSSGTNQALLATLTYRGVGHFFQTEFREAEEKLTEASQLAARLRDGVMLRTALFFLAWTKASLGCIGDAMATLGELLEMAKLNGDTHFLSRVPKRVRWIKWELQGFPHTTPFRQPGQMERGSAAVDDPRSPINLIHLMFESDPSGEHEKDLAEFKEWRFSGVRIQASEAEEALAQGDLELASGQARALLENCTRHGPPKYLAVAHKILAEIAMARGDLVEAERELAGALEPLRTNSAPLVAWKTYATLGRLQRMKNDSRAARAAFRHAAEIVRQIAASVDDEQLRSTFLNAATVQDVLQSSA
ncbi:MAG TPA: protein kinase [Bryobacteraceae bacterium]|nr:protein kinase [Bryobacteraceae bacterium]